MLLVTGDTDGDAEFFLSRILPLQLASSDCVIVLGDFGFVWDGSVKENAVLDKINSLGPQTLFLDGNHDNLPLINTYPVVPKWGGHAHQIRSRIWHLPRGQVLAIEGYKIFVFGGGYSIDRYRRIEGKSYWPEEMPSDAEYDAGRKALQDNRHQVDYILSHAGPYEAMRMFSRFSHKERKLNEFLSWVKEFTKHKHYYFGHLHQDTHLAPNLTVVYDKVYNLETGACLNPQDRPRVDSSGAYT